MSQIVIWNSVSGNFSWNSSFVPNIDEPDENPGQVLDEPLILAVAGAIAAIVVLPAVLSRKGSKGDTP